jgi:LytS/YehU family sensor histidine kinase
MVLQPHIENALRHGLKQKQGQSKLLSIKMRLVDKQLICEIEDNGVGRKKSAEFKKIQYKNYTSKGTLLSESKLNMYAQLTGRIVSTEIIDLYVDEHSKLARGTIVRIIINQ